MASIFDTALNYLSYRSRTEKEVRDYLIKKNFRRDLIPETIDKLKKYNYLNDKEYTLRAIESNAFGKRLSKENLKRYLKQKGISDENLEFVENGIQIEDEIEYCKYHFNKALKRTEGTPYKKRYPKIISYLQRRGFKRDHYQSLLYEIPKTEEVNQLDFEKHLKHYIKLYSRKGLEGFELKNKIIKGMLSRGYAYDEVKEFLDDYENLD